MSKIKTIIKVIKIVIMNLKGKLKKKRMKLNIKKN